MKKIIGMLLSAFVFLINPMTINENNAEENTQQEFIYVEVIEENEQTFSKPREVKVQNNKEINIQRDIKEIKQNELNSELEKIKNIEDKEAWFFAYKDLIFEYVEWIDPPETVFDAFSEEEVNLICRVIETETYDQDFDSKVNVACVVFNRLESGKFGDTITEVVTSPYQFAYGRKNITEGTILAVMYAFECQDTTQGALYFNSFKERKDTFCGANYIFSDQCGHHFYKP